VTEVEGEAVEGSEAEIGVVLEMVAEEEVTEEETEVLELHPCTRLHVMAVARWQKFLSSLQETNLFFVANVSVQRKEGIHAEEMTKEISKEATGEMTATDDQAQICLAYYRK
jgi:hypothetical protein